jgi:hypothetical protein
MLEMGGTFEISSSYFGIKYNQMVILVLGAHKRPWKNSIPEPLGSFLFTIP